MAKVKVCYYELLGVDEKAHPVEIKKAYYKAALKWHPDKNTAPDAEEVFKRIQTAWEVLSNTQERAWYDENKSNLMAVSDPDVLDAGMNLTNKANAHAFNEYDDEDDGFYNVYAATFRAIRDLEQQGYKLEKMDIRLLKPFGNSKSSDAEVSGFYTSWSEFFSARSFGFVKKWKLSTAENRNMRRLMERENKKDANYARKEYSNMVKSLSLYIYIYIYMSSLLSHSLLYSPALIICYCIHYY